MKKILFLSQSELQFIYDSVCDSAAELTKKVGQLQMEYDVDDFHENDDLKCYYAELIDTGRKSNSLIDYLYKKI